MQMWDTKRTFWRESEGAHSFGIILDVPAKVNFTELCTGKSVIFESLDRKEIFSSDVD